jgi:hypothetical protein
MRRVRAALGRVARGRWLRRARWPLAAAGVALALLCAPVAYVEMACRGDPQASAYEPRIEDAVFRRREANAYLTYPEWHFVYAYDGLAEALRTGDEHAFGYASSVAGFWRSACAVMQVADAHGGADWSTRSTIHTIGVSFMVEMGLKAAYEETVGRAAAWLRGPEKTPQDEAIAAMAADYAAFLRQTPWYGYRFTAKAGELWDAPIDGMLRGWERRLGIGAELLGKAAYAKVIEAAVAAAGQAQLEIRSVVDGVDGAALSAIPGVTIVGARAEGVEIQTPRYARFTEILADIARRGGIVREIAGNDDIMVTLTVPPGAPAVVPHGTLILRLPRDGFAGDRLLVDVPVADLAALLRAHPPGDPGLEHVFDY